jgi:hypothetical protein
LLADADIVAGHPESAKTIDFSPDIPNYLLGGLPAYT